MAKVSVALDRDEYYPMVTEGSGYRMRVYDVPEKLLRKYREAVAEFEKQNDRLLALMNAQDRKREGR